MKKKNNGRGRGANEPKIFVHSINSQREDQPEGEERSESIDTTFVNGILNSSEAEVLMNHSKATKEEGIFLSVSEEEFLSVSKSPKNSLSSAQKQTKIRDSIDSSNSSTSTNMHSSTMQINELNT